MFLGLCCKKNTTKKLPTPAIRDTATQSNTLQRSATRCNVVQHAATYCSTLQHKGFLTKETYSGDMTHYNALQHAKEIQSGNVTRCNALQHPATQGLSRKRDLPRQYETLQHTATRTQARKRDFLRQYGIQ